MFSALNLSLNQIPNGTQKKTDDFDFCWKFAWGNMGGLGGEVPQKKIEIFYRSPPRKSQKIRQGEGSVEKPSDDTYWTNSRMENWRSHSIFESLLCFDFLIVILSFNEAS